LIRRAADLYQQRLRSADRRFAGGLKTFASNELLRRRDLHADPTRRSSDLIDEKTGGPQTPAVAADLINLVPLLQRAGKRQDAKTNIDRALTIQIAQFGADSPMTVGIMLASANMAYEQGQYVDARNLADRAR